MIVFLLRNQIKKSKRIVIKLGTSTILDENGNFNHYLIHSLIKQISDLKRQGKEIIIVSSGAIGIGNSILQMARNEETVLKQCSAAVGQSSLMKSYQTLFGFENIITAQLLLINNDFLEIQRRSMLNRLIQKIIDLGIIGIINENDCISTKNITFGDNDILSAHVANLIKADLLIILSDINGIYKNMQTKEIIVVITNVDENIKSFVDKKSSKFGTGGILSKFIAAEMTSVHGGLTVVANSKAHLVIKDILGGKNIGTLFYLGGGNKNARYKKNGKKC